MLLRMQNGAPVGRALIFHYRHEWAFIPQSEKDSATPQLSHRLKLPFCCIEVQKHEYNHACLGDP